MNDLETLRRLALAHPEASEQPHHGRPSFRVGGRIFLTVPDPEHAHVMLDEEQIRAFAAELPGCSEQWWGKKLAALRVELAALDEESLAGLVADAYARRAATYLAPVRLARG